MRWSAVILLAVVACTFDASGLGETPLSGADSGTSSEATTASGPSSDSAAPTSTEDTIGVSGSGSTSAGTGGPGGDPTTTPDTSSGTATEPDTTSGPGTTSTTAPMTTGEPCEMVMLYADKDNDGFGDPNSPGLVCEGTQSWVPNGDDCNDMSANANPNFTEVCDGIDNNCDGKIDEYDATGNATECKGCKYKVREGRLYYFCSNGASWDNAEAYCVGQGLHLVKDDGGGEHDFLLAEMGNTGFWWIGANDKGSEGDFKWVSDGADVPEPGLWSAGQPDDQEWWLWEDCDCAGMLDSNGEMGFPGQAARWADNECGDSHKFICEGTAP